MSEEETSNQIALIPFTHFHKMWCKEKTAEFMNSPFSLWFREPPENSICNFDEYLKVIKSPICLKEISERIKNDCYHYVCEWVSDMDRVWQNAKEYNPPGTDPYCFAEVLEMAFNKTCLPIPVSQKEAPKADLMSILLDLKNTIDSTPKWITELEWKIPYIPKEIIIGMDLPFYRKKSEFQKIPELENVKLGISSPEPEDNEN